MPNPQTAAFPTAIATDLILMVASNRALSQLTAASDGVQTQFTIADGSNFQVPCLVQIDTEVILVGAISGNVLQSCVRGFALTSSSTHAQNADVKGYVFSYHHNQLAAEVKAIEFILGPNCGNVVMQNDEAGGDLTNEFSNLRLIANGVTAGTYGSFNKNVQITVDNTGRVTDITNAVGNTNYPIFYKGAILQGANAILGFSFGDSDVATPVPYIESSAIYAVASFTQGNNNGVQDHFYLPDDWVGDAISLDIYWRTSAIVGQVTWTVACSSVRPGTISPITFNEPAAIATVVSPTANTIAKSRITPLFLTGINAGDELFFRFARDAGDTAAAPAEMISIKFNINRNFALVQ